MRFWSIQNYCYEYAGGNKNENYISSLLYDEVPFILQMKKGEETKGSFAYKYVTTVTFSAHFFVWT